ncbi:MAG: polysaccharide biosynthesis tyrosine autokinase, partial [Phycisphaerales bacterium]|nr:polysaccharide biosynthesis tyrosine autokinase [Phycisphaerales bacterium]
MPGFDLTAAARPSRMAQVAGMIWRCRWMALAMAVVGLVTALVTVQLFTPIYTSQAEIYFQRNGAQLLDETPSVLTGVGEKFLATQARVIQSPAVLAVALDNMEKSGVMLNGDEDALSVMQKGIDVHLSRDDDIMRVRFSSADANLAQAIVNNVIEAYRTFQKSKDQLALDALANERARLTAELQTKKQQMLALKEQFGVNAFSDTGNSLDAQRLENLYQSLTTAHVEAINAKSAYAEAAASLANNPELLARIESGGLAGMPTSAVDQATLRSELFNLQQRLAEARRQYMSGHPIIRAIQGRIDELSVAYVGAAREHWLAVQRRETDLQSSYDQQQKQLLAMQGHRHEYDQLHDEAADLEKLSADLTSQYNKLVTVQSVGQLNMTVLNPATVADKPSWPNIPVALGLGLVAGLVLGLGGGLVMQLRNQQLRSVEEVQQALMLPVLGLIPAMRRERSPAHRGQKTDIDPASPVAQAFGEAGGAVRYALGEEKHKTILVASPLAGDGKSTVAANLAIALARAGNHVLLIDANLRMPFMHRIFSLTSSPGLCEVLMGADAQSAIIKTAVVNLELLPSGMTEADPAGMLNSQDFSDLLGDMASRFDYVVVDAPALADTPDARIIAAWCDATVLVLQADRAQRKLAEMARQGLMAVGANLIGTMINEINPDS